MPSKKNGMVANHYSKLGFTADEGGPEGRTTWSFEVPASRPAATHSIRVTSEPLGSAKENSMAHDALAVPAN
jgi:hypothetical protein